MDSRKIVLGAIVFAVISQVVYTLGAFADMPYYTDPAYSAVWSKLMMPGLQPPTAEFYLLSMFFSLVMGLIFSYAYSLVGHALMVKGSFKADKSYVTGAKYGLLVFGLAGIGSLTMPLLVNVPFGLAISWTVQSLIAYVLAGAAVGKISGK